MSVSALSKNHLTYDCMPAGIIIEAEDCRYPSSGRQYHLRRTRPYQLKQQRTSFKYKSITSRCTWQREGFDEVKEELNRGKRRGLYYTWTTRWTSAHILILPMHDGKSWGVVGKCIHNAVLRYNVYLHGGLAFAMKQVPSIV